MRLRCRHLAVLLTIGCAHAAAAAAAGAAPPAKLKIYISVDMEGIAGVVTDEQLGPKGFEYERFREFMTAEAATTAQAALDAGATEVVVSDSHGNGQSLLIDKLPKSVSIVRSWPRPLLMMQGIDETFDGAILIGYHSGTTNTQGVRAHTMSSARFADVRLNDTSVSEAVISAAIAGHFNVPVIMVSGDDAATAEARASLGNIEAAVVKWAYGFHSARTLTPSAANDLIRQATEKALARRKDLKPFRLSAPVRLDLRFKSYRPSELLSYLPGIQRTDAHSIRFVGKDIVEVSKFIEFVTNYESDLTP